MLQPKKKVTIEFAERQRDSLNNESDLKRQAAYGAKNINTGIELMKNSNSDHKQSEVWDRNIKEAKDRLKKG